MYRRRRYYYGKARKTVRRYKRRYPIRKSVKPKSKYDQVHLVKRFGSLMTGSSTVVTTINNPFDNQSYKFYFRLDAVTAYQDFTNLYDMYKIRAVKVSFIPVANITTASESGYASLIYSTYDFNGPLGGAPPNKDQIREYQYCKWSPYGKIHKRYFFPRITDTTSDTGVSTKVGPQNWISTANHAAPYYGLLVNVSNVPSIPEDEPIYRVEVKYYLSFKNTK